ncbi:MAG: PTS sugar transporter subunit IIA [Candidatus Kapabacteria bacterium]|nr:PTS sugar transporter subunit IIA [Candidatus Kapabacteria bacterium]
MNLSDILTPSRIEVQQVCASKNDVLDTLLAILEKNGDIANVDDVRKVIWERENLMSTGIGHGIALPHGKSNAVQRVSASAITLAKPVDYESLDGKPVLLAIMLIGRENEVSTHLKLLSKLSRILISDSFRFEALKATTSDDLYRLFVHEEQP